MEATYWRTLMKPKRLLFGMTPQRGTADLNYSRGGKVKKAPNSMLTLLETETAQLIRRRKNGTLQYSYLVEITICKVMFARSTCTWAPALKWCCVHTITNCVKLSSFRPVSHYFRT